MVSLREGITQLLGSAQSWYPFGIQLSPEGRPWKGYVLSFQSTYPFNYWFPEDSNHGKFAFRMYKFLSIVCNPIRDTKHDPVRDTKLSLQTHFIWKIVNQLSQIKIS